MFVVCVGVGGVHVLFYNVSRVSDHSIAMVIPVLPYTIERVLTRQIAKFGVQGTEYRLRVEHINDGIPYVTAVDMIHDMFDRAYFIFMFFKMSK